MSLIDPNSCECLKSELELFQVPPTQVAIDKSYYVKYHSLTSLEKGGPIEFRINAGEDVYIDPSNIILYTKNRILDHNSKEIPKLVRNAADNADIDNIANTAYPVNYFHATRFKNVEIHLNNQLISSNDNLYAFRSYLEFLLSYSQEVKITQGYMSQYYKDTTDIDNNFEGIGEKATINNKTNYGARRVWELANNSQPFETLGRIHADLLNQGKLLPGNCILKIKFHRHDSKFCLMSKDEVEDYIISIDEAFLLVRHVEISPSIREAHLKTLQNTPMKFPVRRVEMTYFTRGPNRQDLSESNLINGPLPRRVIIGLVQSNAFHGDKKFSPFNFKNFGVQSIVLRVGGSALPYQEPLNMNYNKNCAMQGYLSLLQGTGRLFADSSNGIDLFDYVYLGKCLYVFDLSNDLSDGGHFELVREGELGVEITLSDVVEESITIVCYFEYDAVLRIDENKEVHYME